ncbi:hypothetical protein NDU88_000973 [Pleurodeles waltl]|uniref:Uncharacterized protein n=1 Tax=Pleurodeles waltl TaxID=8319 RepID=A0AAV7VW83_PLEWA|nr:hypothetical protein NDU88_000973 [Pleurodeles waltl]
MGLGISMVALFLSTRRGAWPRTRRWRTPEFLAPEGPARKRAKAHPLRADRGPCGGVEPTEATGRVWAPVATLESAGGRKRPFGELEGRRPGRVAEAATSRWAVIHRGVWADGPKQRGTLDESPSGYGGASWGPGAQVRTYPVGVRRGGAPGYGRPPENTGNGPR